MSIRAERRQGPTMRGLTDGARWAVAAASLALVILALLLRVWLSVEPTQSSVVLSGESATGTIVSVAPGSFEWIQDVRPGSAYERIEWESGVGASVRTGSLTVDIPDAWLPLEPWNAAVALGLLGASLLLWRSVPFIGALGICAAVFLATAEMTGMVAMPLLALVLVTPTAGAMVVALGRYRAGSLLAGLAMLLLIVFAIVVVVWSFQPEPDFLLLWDVARHTPLVIVAVIAAEVTIGLLIAIRLGRQEREPTSLAVLRSTDAGRRALRLTAEDERDQSAQRVHDQVLPRLRAGLMWLESGHAQRSEEELRRLAEDLRGQIMADQLLVLRDAGLVAAIGDVVDRVQGGPTGTVEATASGAGARPPLIVELAALRIAQEAINNIVVHASADEFAVRLDVRHDRVRMEIEDDGVGIDAAQTDDPASHLGIRSMVNRATEVGGMLAVEPGTESGTLVRFSWTA